MDYLIKNATIVNEDAEYSGSVLVSGGFIKKIYKDKEKIACNNAEVIDATGKHLIPGIIDEHVHFREPGLTQKADIKTESRAAVAGGVTSFMEMPNTNPQTTTLELVREKMRLASDKSLANFSFYIGATNDNLDEIVGIDPQIVCGIKLFMGSSTGNMLVDDDKALEELFRNAPCIIAAHCEDEATIRENTMRYKEMVLRGEVKPDASLHPKIRTAEACYKSSARAVELASKTGAKLHVMHISTAQELSLFSGNLPLMEKKITAETCPHYLFFDESDYLAKGFAIKCNPAIKTASDREMLLHAIKEGIIDTIGSDHAPHLWEEKNTGDYFSSKSGFPSIQNNFDLMFKKVKQGYITLPELIRLMCHNPAVLYQIDRRGFIREGYYADLVLVNLHSESTLSRENLHYKCGWSPYEGISVGSKVTNTFVNGNLVYEDGVFHEGNRGVALSFSRA